MLNPRYDRKEAVNCAGCALVSITVGYLPDMNYLSMGCISNINAIAY